MSGLQEPEFKPVSEEEARRAAPEVRSPDELALEEKRLAHQQATFQQELGAVGKIIGSKHEKPGNIAFLVILICFSFLVVIGVSMAIVAAYNPQFGSTFDNFMKISTAVFAIITGALGYIFGSSTKS